MSALTEIPRDLPSRERWKAESKVVLALAIPALALNGLQAINNLLDTYFVGHLPKAALTAHGAAMNVMFLMFSLAMATSVASTAMVARAYGAGQPEEWKEANRQCMSLGIWISLALSVLCFAVSGWVPAHLIPGNNVEAQTLLRDFLRIYALGIPATAIITTLSGSMRGTGDTVSPMFISGIQILMHVVLNVFLIYPSGNRGIAWFPNLPGADLGFLGAGYSLVGSAWISALVYMLYARRTKVGAIGGLRLPVRNWFNRIMNIAGPNAVQSLLRVGSFTMFTILVSHTPQGSDALGALRIGITIESIMFMPAFAFAVAAGALVGQNLGAKRPDQAARLGWLSAHFGGLVILLLSVPLFIYAPQVSAALTGGDKPTMAYEAAQYIRILIVTEVLFGYAMVLIGAMQGAGDAKRTMWITVATLWGMRVPLAFLLTLPAFGLGSSGAWIAMSVSQAAQGIVAMIWWHRGHWKSVQV